MIEHWQPLLFLNDKLILPWQYPNYMDTPFKFSHHISFKICRPKYLEW